MKVTRKLASAFAAAALGLSACAGTSSTQPSGEGQPSDGAEASQAARAYEGQQLIITSFGSAYDDNFRTAVTEPFTEEFGAEVVLVTMYSAPALAQLRAGGGSDSIDIVQFSAGQEIQAADEGLIQPVDPTAIAAHDDLYEQALHEDFGPAFSIYSDGIIYNTEHVTEAPTSWNALTDPAYEGKVAIPDITNSSGVGLLVTLAQMNGGSAEDIDPGFEAVESLLPNVVAIYPTVPEMIQLLAQEEAWLTVYSSAYGIQLKQQGLPVEFAAPEEGGNLYRITMNVVTGSEKQDLALEFINFALRPEVQAEWATLAGYAPTNKLTELPEEVAALMPYGEDEVSRLELLDSEVVNERRPEWTERWNRLISE